MNNVISTLKGMIIKYRRILPVLIGLIAIGSVWYVVPSNSAALSSKNSGTGTYGGVVTGGNGGIGGAGGAGGVGGNGGTNTDQSAGGHNHQSANGGPANGGFGGPANGGNACIRAGCRS